MAPRPANAVRTAGELTAWRRVVMGHAALSYRERLIGLAHAEFVPWADGATRVHYAGNQTVADRAGIGGESGDDAVRAASRKMVDLGLIERHRGPGVKSTSYTVLLNVA